MPVPGAERRICDAVNRWDRVTSAAHRYGGIEFRLGRREIGHIHRDSLVDIPFPKPVRDALVAAGEAEPHHILPDSGWVSVFLRSDDDVARAIRLLRQSLDLALSAASRKSAAGAQHGS